MTRGMQPGMSAKPRGNDPPRDIVLEGGHPEGTGEWDGQTPASEPEKPHLLPEVTLQEGLTSGHVSPDWQCPHPDPEMGVKTLSQRQKGSRNLGFGPPTCGHRQTSNPGVMPPQSGASAPTRDGSTRRDVTTTTARTHAEEAIER